MSKHTELPLRTYPAYLDEIIVDKYGHLIANCSNQANAAFIVRACNCHDELVEALKHIKSEYGYCLPEKTMQKINKAIAKAEGDWEDSLIERPEIGREADHE